jgi:hypothetical protein
MLAVLYEAVTGKLEALPSYLKYHSENLVAALVTEARKYVGACGVSASMREEENEGPQPKVPPPSVFMHRVRRGSRWTKRKPLP